MLLWYHGNSQTGGLPEKYTPATDLVNVFPGSVFQLTEDVVNRMKESSQGKRDYQRSPRASNGTAPSSLAVAGRPRPTGTVGVLLLLRVTEDAGIFQCYLAVRGAL